MNDIVKKKSLREVLPVKAKDRQKAQLIEKEEVELGTYYEDRGYSGTKIFFSIVFLIIILIGGYYASNVFAFATLTITPKQETVDISGQYQASLAPADSGLEFAVMKLDDSASTTIPANGVEKISAKATGAVTIFNAFSTTAARLAAGTRLETADGKIFRTNQAVSIPGLTKKGKISTPGQVTATVTADQPDASYNIAPTTLKVTAYKGSAKYTQIYAQVKTGLAGGASGTRSKAADADVAKAISDLQKKLADRLTKQSKLEIPKDFVLFDDGVALTYDESLDSAASSSAVLTENAHLTAIIFNINKLSLALLKTKEPDIKDDAIKISNLSQLNFKLDNKQAVDISKASQISFTLNGKANFEWPVDTENLKDKLAGSPVKDREQVFSAYPNIYRAESTVRPPWIMTFPANRDKISVKLIESN